MISTTIKRRLLFLVCIAITTKSCSCFVLKKCSTARDCYTAIRSTTATTTIGVSSPLPIRESAVVTAAATTSSSLALYPNEICNVDKNNTQWQVCLNGVTRKPSALNEAITYLAFQNNISLTLDEANDLIELGAVWARMDAITERDVLSQYDDDGTNWNNNEGIWNPSSSKAQLKYGDFPKGWGSGGDSSHHNECDNEEEEDNLEDYVRELQSTRYRRLLSPCTIEQGVDLRVYPYPRRFKAFEELRPSSLLYEDTTYLVVNKPPMLPTQPDASNYRECVPGAVEHNYPPLTTIQGEPVTRALLCHRVDACVGGCVVLSKDTRGQQVFSRLQRERKVKKLYLAVTKNPVPLGQHIHWMWAPVNMRGVDNGPPCQFLSHQPPASRRVARDFWIRCVLEVTKCEPIHILDDEDDDTLCYQSTIRLVTGRKHQVRAQLSSLNCPIIRDTLYEPIAGLTLDALGEEEGGGSESAMDNAVKQCRVPTQPIGLQAHAILFGGIKVKAPIPWWGDRVVTPQ